MIQYIDIQDIGFCIECVIDAIGKIESLCIDQCDNTLCLKLAGLGFIYKQKNLLPVWIPSLSFFPSINPDPKFTPKQSSDDEYLNLVLQMHRDAMHLTNKRIRSSETTRLKLITEFAKTPIRLTTPNSTIILPGSFDGLHQGHINLISISRFLGNKIVTILDSDNRLLLRKGLNRPFQKLSKRIREIEKTRLVDEILVLNQQNEFESLLGCYKNPLVVKGSEYRNGFLEFSQRTSDFWKALCVESHSSERSSNLNQSGVSP